MSLPVIQKKVACFVSLNFKSLNIDDLLFDIELHGPVNIGASGRLYLIIVIFPGYLILCIVKPKDIYYDAKVSNYFG